MPTTTDLIGLAIDKNPVDFATAFDEILRQKQEEALEAHKVELAKGIYGEANPTGEEDEDDFGEGEFDSEDDGDYDAGDDLDIDLDELDLDELDLDLEDITNDDEDA